MVKLIQILQQDTGTLRFCAVLYLKNFVKKYWQGEDAVQIPIEEKEYLKSIALNMVKNIGEQKIVQQMNDVIAEIASHDFPGWVYCVVL